jgi:CHAT domain-containing protein
MDIAVSSYAPTLETLLKPRVLAPSSCDTDRILVVSQPDALGLPRIPGAEREAELIRQILPDSTDILNRSRGTVAAVLSAMESHSWVHLSCHGIQHPHDPTKSAFSLHNGELTLSMLMSKSLPHAELAFLSACQTATGDEALPEEAVHLAAGMLSVGYKSVVGTMWSIGDYQATIVAEHFYRAICKQINSGREVQPAYALHDATKHLRELVGPRDLIHWVPFLHFGI